MGRYYYKFNYNYQKPRDCFKRSKKVECTGDIKVLKNKYERIKEEMEEKTTMWLMDKECVKKENSGWVYLNTNGFCNYFSGVPSMMGDDCEFEWVKPIQKFCKYCDNEVKLTEECPCNGNKNWKKDMKESMELMMGEVGLGNYILVKTKNNEFILD